MDWHENFTMITRLQGESNPTYFLLKTNIGWRRYKPLKLQPSKCTKLFKKRPLLSNDFQKFNTSWIDLKFLPLKLDIMRGFFQNFIEIENTCKSYSSQSESNSKNFKIWTPGRLGVKIWATLLWWALKPKKSWNDVPFFTILKMR